jgi:hypothetical protein
VGRACQIASVGCATQQQRKRVGALCSFQVLSCPAASRLLPPQGLREGLRLSPETNIPPIAPPWCCLPACTSARHTGPSQGSSRCVPTTATAAARRRSRRQQHPAAAGSSCLPSSGPGICRRTGICQSAAGKARGCRGVCCCADQQARAESSAQGG